MNASFVSVYFKNGNRIFQMPTEKKSDTFSNHGIKKGTAKHQMWCLAALLVINKCQICLFVIYLGACSQLLFSKKYLVNCTKYNQDTHNNRQCHDINLLLFNFTNFFQFAMQS